MSPPGKILVTGGTGFVGSNLAVSLAAGSHPASHVIALDNLYRQGPELNLDRLAAAGVIAMPARPWSGRSTGASPPSP